MKLRTYIFTKKLAVNAIDECDAIDTLQEDLDNGFANDADTWSISINKDEPAIYNCNECGKEIPMDAHDNLGGCCEACAQK